jgi:hypothetical protein
VNRARAIDLLRRKDFAVMTLRSIAAGEDVELFVQRMAVRRLLYDPKPTAPHMLAEPQPIPMREPGCDDDRDDSDMIPLGEVLDQITLGYVEGPPESADERPLSDAELHPVVRHERCRRAWLELRRAWLADVGKTMRAIVDRTKREIQDLGPLATADDRQRLRFFERALELFRWHYRNVR